MKKIFLLPFLPLFLLTEFTIAENIFVSTSGSDLTGVGTLAQPYSTIQKGIDMSQDGDTVYVASGTYTGTGNRNIDLRGKRITLRSIAGELNTTIDLGGHKGFSATSTENLDTIISGFTIKNGYAIASHDWAGVGIIDVWDPAGLTIKNCIFTQNEVSTGYITTSASIINKVETEGKVHVENVLFYDNICRGGSWAGPYFTHVVGMSGPDFLAGRKILADTMVINHCTIVNNRLLPNGTPPGGVAVLITGSISNTIVWGNDIGTNHNVFADRSIAYLLHDGTLSGDLVDGTIMSSDPLFVDAAQGNFRLAVDSPARNNGDPTSEPNTDGSRADIGYRYPTSFDSDNDGVNDYREDKDRTDPTDPNSFNPLSKGLVAYYPLKNSYLDESGLANDLKDPSAGISFSYDRFGRPANSLRLASAQDRITSLKKTGINGNQPHSISLWFYVDQTPNWNMRYLGTLLTIRDPQSSAGVGAEHRIGLETANGKTRVGSHGGYSDFYIELSENSLDKQWHHLLVVYGGELTTSSIFIDGHLVTPNIIDPAFSSARNLVDGLIYLGSSPLPDGSNADGTSNANISDVRIYNRSLSDDEVRKLYYSESLTVGHRHFVESNPDLLGHYSKADYNANRTNGQIDVTTNPSAFNLFTQEQFDSNRTAGQSDVINNPMSYGLYTSDSIMDLRMGGLMIQRIGTNAVVSFQPQTTTDLNLPFTNNGTPITNTIPMPGNKGFLRINAKPEQSAP